MALSRFLWCLSRYCQGFDSWLQHWYILLVHCHTLLPWLNTIQRKHQAINCGLESNDLFIFFRFWLCQLTETQKCDCFSISKHTMFKHYQVSLTATTFGEEGVTIGRRLTFRLTEEGQKLWDAIEKETIFTEALAVCCWSFWYFASHTFVVVITSHLTFSCIVIKYLPQDISSYLPLEHFLKPAKSKLTGIRSEISQE